MQTEYCNYTLTGQTHYSSGLFRNPANTMNTKSNEELLELIYDGMYGLIELEIFSYAFRLGGRLMLATLMDSGEDA